MTEQTIDVTGLPEGWRAVAYRRPISGEYYFYNDGIQHGKTGSGQFLIVEKIKPRRVVLEETEEANIPSGTTYEPQWFGSVCMVNQPKIWRIVYGE